MSRPPVPSDQLPLFVYGTLQPGQERWQLIADLIADAGKATAAGSLVRTREGWPAATFRGEGTIHGTLLRTNDADTARELYLRCDEIEGAPHLFRRVAIDVRISGGEVVEAAAYEWNSDRRGAPGRPIPDGRWTPDPGS